MFSSPIISTSKLIPSFIIITLAGLGVLELQKQEQARVEAQLKQTKYDVEAYQSQRELSALRLLPAVGFDNLLADWVFLRFIQYFGDTKTREATNYELCPTYFNLVIRHDPRFTNAVHYLDLCTSIFAGYPKESINNLQNSLSTMKPKMEGITLRPYYLWRSLGIAQILFLGEPLEAAQSYETAIEWAKPYNDTLSYQFINNAQQSISFLKTNPDVVLAQIGAWASVLGNNPDERMLTRVIKEVEALGGEVEVKPNGEVRFIAPTEKR